MISLLKKNYVGLFFVMALLSVLLTENGFAGTISGTLSYSGTSAKNIYVGVFTSPDFYGQPSIVVQLPALGSYSLTGLDDGTYYLVVLICDGPNLIQQTDPWGVYGGSMSNPTPVTIAGNSTASNVDITLQDGTLANPPPFYQPGTEYTYDVSLNGIPRFVQDNYIEIDKIDRISKFRSGEGHDYSDDFEQCRSMKHYLVPRADVDSATIKVYSPVAGTISRITQEGYPNSGMQVQIRPSDPNYQAFQFILFHVNVDPSLAQGGTVLSGQQIGTHIGSITDSDIAVGVNTPTGWKLVSYFDVMADSLFASYAARGVPTRDAIIITKEARDVDPLSPCDGSQFTVYGSISNWVTLTSLTCSLPATITVPTSDPDGGYSVSWTASATTGETYNWGASGASAEVTYKLEEATDSTFTTGLRTAYTGTALTTAVTGQTTGTTYFYRVKATKSGYTDSTWKNGSNGCLVKFPAGAPATITVLASDADGIYPVKWTASATTGVTYVLQEATNSLFTVGCREAYRGTALTFNIPKRVTAKTYYYRAKAIKTGYTDSAYRAGNNGCAVPGTTTVATPPTLTFTAIILHGYTVNWGASTTTGVTYILQEATNSAFTTGLRTPYTGTAKLIKIIGRTAGVTYYYRVRAIKAGAKDSAWKGSYKKAT